MKYTVICILCVVYCILYTEYSILPRVHFSGELGQKGCRLSGVSVSGAAGAEISLTNVPAPRVLETFLWLFVCFLSFCF